MALSPNQLNAQLRTLLQNEIAAQGQSLDWDVLMFLIRACVRHYRTGNADAQEAAQTIARWVTQNYNGRTPTTDDLHRLRWHWAQEAEGNEKAEGIL